MNMPTSPPWAQAVVGLLLVISGLFSLLAAWGITRLRDYFQRMHPPSLVTTGAAWCTSLATIMYFSTLQKHFSLKTWLVIIMLSITVPITTLMLARTALFRRRQQKDPDVPAPLSIQTSQPMPDQPDTTRGGK